MPTYDYVCRACGHEFELFQQISEPVKKKCPKCGTLKLERRIGTGAGVIFKGSGFYQTDYRSPSYQKAAAEEKGGSSDKKTAADDKSGTPEKKPATEKKGKASTPDSAPGSPGAE
jgi:putative FmdB family regulatory protein